MPNPNTLFAKIWGQKKILNPGMENWASSTNLDDWGEVVSGGSTVSRYEVVVYRDTYSALLACDGVPNAAGIQQQPLLDTDEWNLRVVHQGILGPTNVLIQNDNSSNYLQANGTWGASLAFRSFGPNLNFDANLVTFTPESAHTHTIQIFALTASMAAVIGEVLLFKTGDRGMSHADNKIWANKLRQITNGGFGDYIPT